MKASLKLIKANWKLISIVAGTAAALFYPGLRLFKLIQSKIAERKNAEGGEQPVKAFSPAYRGKHKPHHRHAHNSNVGPEMA